MTQHAHLGEFLQRLQARNIDLASYDSEIAALVEAAERATWRWEEADHEMGQAGADEEICEALDALDRKAQRLRGAQWWRNR